MQKKIVFFSILFFLIPVVPFSVLVTKAEAMVSTNSSGSSSSASRSVTTKVAKSAGIVKYYDGKTLVLQDNKRYLLAGVKVFDRSKSPKNKKKTANVKMAETTFVNGRLSEVVILLR